MIPRTSAASADRSSRSLVVRLALSLAVALGAWLALAAPAGAKVTHVQEGTFPLGGVDWVSVDNSGGPGAGNVWVSEIEVPSFASKVFQVDQSGNPTGVVLDGATTPGGDFEFINFSTFQVASGARVDNSGGANAGNVYLPDLKHQVVNVFDEGGAYVCQITGKATPSATECAGPTGSQTPTGELVPLAVAIDPADGDVYVGNGNGVVYKFNEAGEYTGEISDPNITTPGALAFDSDSNLYVANGNPFMGGASAVKFTAGGTFAYQLAASRLAVAVDLTSDDVYLGGNGGGIEQFDAAGNLLGSFAGEANSIDLDSTSGKVYVTVGAGQSGQIWGPSVFTPDVTVAAATGIDATVATLHGEVGPGGGPDVQSCEFEYGTTTAYGNTAPCSPSTPYSESKAVSAALSGLDPSTTYHYRIVASNENEVDSVSEDMSFNTPGPPTVDAQSVDSVTRTSALLKATINPHGGETGYVFQYVTQAQYEVDGFDSAQVTPSTGIGSGETGEAVSQPISGLEIGTEYRFRAVATNGAGEAPGSAQSFTTVPVAEIEGQYTKASLRNAKLEAEINPHGLASNCQVQWVSDAEFEQSGYGLATTVPCVPADLGSGTDTVTAYANIDGLEVATGYHFRFIVENSAGTEVGEDREFTTFGIESFSIEALDEAGELETRAGAHPYELVAKIDLTRTIVPGDPNNERIRVTGVAKDILTELPPGLIGDPTATPRCLRRTVEETRCTGDAQVGQMTVNITGGAEELGAGQRITRGIFNSVAPQGKPATFVSNYFNVSVNAFVDAGIRTGGDYGINAGATNIIELANVVAVEVRMWGVPARTAHNAERECGLGGKNCASNAEPRAFLRNPTSCTGPLTARAKANSYADPKSWVYASQEMPAITACNQVEFEPTIEARPTSRVADSPTGLRVDIHNPQNDDPEGLGVADLRKAVVTLPKGLTINPAGANGLQACSPSQVDLKGPDAAQCPDGSRVGRVEIETPLVDHPLHGGVFVATPHDNPFNSLIALYIAVDDPRTGVVVKLAGEVRPDPETGQLTATFDDNPQLPFDHFRVEFFSGALAPLKTPSTCGTFSTEAVLTPWSAPDSGPPANISDSYEISDAPAGGACPASEGDQPNNPAFSAGTQAPIGGKYSPFSLNLRREPGSQQFQDLTVTPPPGLVAKLAGTPYCPDASLAAAAGQSGNAEKASPSCPSASRIGTVTVGAGAGPAPYYAEGTAYLAGPYKGAPLSMAIVTPATAGPFDLGTVVVRAALHVNPETTQITAKADPIPRILQGIPLDVRSVAVKLDKPGFTLNPTSCDAMSVGAQMVSTLGQSASLSDRFQLGDCTSLGFKPKLALRLFGKTNRGAHPKFQAILTMPEGGANITRASVKLPRSEILDQGHIRTICTRVQFAADACPQASIYGYAQAWSPLLEQPIQGPVYLRSSSNKLPDLVADLNGQIRVAVVGRIDSVNGGIRNTFDLVPDAPVTKFVLTMQGGSKGLLQNSTNICRGTHKALALFDAHNGAVHDVRPVLKNSKCAKAKRKTRRPGRGGSKR